MARRHHSRKPMAEINVVPYIDVMLVLLIIFMITAPLLTQGVKVDLPQGEADTIEEQAKRPLVVTVDVAGQFHITYDDDRSKAVDRDTLVHDAAAILNNNPGIPVYVKGDRHVEYQRVMDAMVALQAAGAASVGLIAEPAEGR
jgi:biopolymer transport protein TolR